MDRVRIIGCAYRTWALNIMDYIKRQPGVEIKILKGPEEVTLEVIEPYQPELILFYGWSWKVPPIITSNYSCLCLHPSPLPKYRGGSPLQNQIMNGEIESAVSIFRMNGEIDAGELCAQVPFSLEGELWEVLKNITAIGEYETLRIIREYRSSGITFWPQQGEPSYFQRRKPEESEITKEELELGTARFLYNKIRCLQGPYPSAFIRCSDGHKLFITEASCDE